MSKEVLPVLLAFEKGLSGSCSYECTLLHCCSCGSSVGFISDGPHARWLLL